MEDPGTAYHGATYTRRVIRRATNADLVAVQRVIAAAYAPFGDPLALDGYDRDLTDLEAAYDARGGVFVVLDVDGRIRGTHAVLPLHPPAVATFRRWYLDTDRRGRGEGGQLMQWTIDWARDAGFERVDIWSDVRFERAHGLFERFGFVRGAIRPATTENPYEESAFTLDLTRGA